MLQTGRRQSRPELSGRTRSRHVLVVDSGGGVVSSVPSRSPTTTSTRSTPVNTAASRRRVISAISRSTPSKIQTYTSVARRHRLPEVGEDVHFRVGPITSSTLYSAKAIIAPHRIMWSWYTGRWWVSCYIWYSEEGTGRGQSPSLYNALLLRFQRVNTPFQSATSFIWIMKITR